MRMLQFRNCGLYKHKGSPHMIQRANETEPYRAKQCQAQPDSSVARCKFVYSVQQTILFSLGDGMLDIQSISVIERFRNDLSPDMVIPSSVCWFANSHTATP